MNQEVGIFLQHYVNYQQDNWTEWLAAAEFCYDTVKGEVVIFFIFFRILYWILLWIYFSFIILMMIMKRHMTLWLHDMSHDVMS